MLFTRASSIVGSRFVNLCLCRLFWKKVLTCRKGSQEDRCVHHPRSLPHQDQEQASHKGMHKDDFRQGDQGEGQASEDSCESFSSCCPKAADLSSVQSIALLSTLSMAQSCLR